MKENLMEDLELFPDQVNVKATTEEHLGFTGREEGISAQAVCLLSNYDDAVSVDVTDKGMTASQGCASGQGCAGASGGCPAIKALRDSKDTGKESKKSKKDKSEKSLKKKNKKDKDKKEKKKYKKIEV